AASNRNHGVDCHNAGLDRLADRFSLDDSRGDLFNGIADCSTDGAFAIDRLAKGIDDTTQQPCYHRDLTELPSGADFVAFTHLAPVAQNDCADFGFFQVKGETDDP